MNRLNITDTILDLLGFSEYWDENCTWGGRILTFKNGTKFRIIQQEEMDDSSSGFDFNGRYVAKHFYFVGWFAMPTIDAKHHDLFFLHEIYECIKNHYPDSLEEFLSKCNDLKMKVYIDEYLSHSVEQNLKPACR